ncbi:hypothetical protein TNCT_288751 [Trichonephila clavata]|uniref:Uncharacterized protein n=1 Tax=Trichonephila clavata TaxID=2740835 RepID=A0A8X6KWB7_TRICU|nr:hypothetical protein TNCT_288751 [Trichonephila clavata]
MSSSQLDWNEEEIERERCKTSYVLTNNEAGVVENWYYRYVFPTMIELFVLWHGFFVSSTNVTGKKHSELTVTECQEAETKVLLMIQNESFLSEEEKRLKSLQTFKA